MENNKCIYIVYAVSVNRLTEGQLKNEYKKWKIDNPTRNMEDFLWFYKDLKQENPEFSINREPVIYFDNDDDAIDFAKSNGVDFNEGGVYNYALVERVPLGLAYPESRIDKKYAIFEYDTKTSAYIEIKNTDIEKLIVNKYIKNLFE